VATGVFPYRCSGVSEYACYVKKLRQNVGFVMSYCDVTSSVFPVTMTTIRHCSILEFGRGHRNKQSPRASPDLCTPLLAAII